MAVLLAVVGLAVAFLAAIHLLLPSSNLNQALSTLPVIAHGLAFPLPGGVVLALVGIVALLLVLRRRRHGDRARWPWLVTASCIALSGVLLALSTTSVGLPGPREKNEVDVDASLMMVSWNALDHFDGASAEQIFGALEADVAVLPELENRDGVNGGASRIQEALAGGGLDPAQYDIFESPPTGTRIAPLAVIVRKGFGTYASVAVDQVTFGTVHLVPPAGSGLPEILAVHTAPPVPRWMAAWEADLTSVLDLAQDVGANAIIAGDLNATLRHGAMGAITSHADALTAVPAGERGTWPANAPPVLRSSIDHVLIPTSAFAVGDASVIGVPGSDHAAVATRIFFHR